MGFQTPFTGIWFRVTAFCLLHVQYSLQEWNRNHLSIHSNLRHYWINMYILQIPVSFFEIKKIYIWLLFFPWFGKVDPVGRNNWWPGLMTQGNHWPQRLLLRQSCVLLVFSKSLKKTPGSSLSVISAVLWWNHYLGKCIYLPWEIVKHWRVNEPAFFGLCGFAMNSNRCWKVCIPSLFSPFPK